MWTLLLMQVLADEREAAIDVYAKKDLAVFQKADGKFGMGRMEGTVRAAGNHGLAATFAFNRPNMDRFLVGNKTASFSAKSFRVTFVPMDFRMPKPGVPKPERKSTFKPLEVERLIRDNFGKEFVASIKPDGWLVKGYPIRAKASCLNCHKTAKTGDALGYLVYAAPKPTGR
jgi:hypothetical protein